MICGVCYSAGAEANIYQLLDFPAKIHNLGWKPSFMAILLENSVEDLGFFPPWIPYFADGRRILEKTSMSIPTLVVLKKTWFQALHAMPKWAVMMDGWWLVGHPRFSVG